jgi:hypothetical protein
MGVTTATHLICAHEIAHAVLAHQMGLDVVWVRRDRHDSGQTCAVFRDDDPRDLKQMAFAQAVYRIGAVDAEPGFVDGEQLFCSDADVRTVFDLAEKAGFTVEAASARARELRASDVYREAHAFGVDLLLHKVHLDRRDLKKFLK